MSQLSAYCKAFYFFENQVIKITTKPHHRCFLPSGYPTDTYTNPNNKVAKVQGDGNKIGPSIVLKVMAGDKFNFRVSSWYKTNGASPQSPTGILSALLSALNTGVGGLSPLLVFVQMACSRAITNNVVSYNKFNSFNV